jgi:hypothetical protein
MDPRLRVGTAGSHGVLRQQREISESLSHAGDEEKKDGGGWRRSPKIPTSQREAEKS